MSDLLLPSHYRKNDNSFNPQTFTYLQNKEGHIIIPLDESGVRRKGYQRFDIPMHNTREVERVSRLFEAQKQREFMTASQAQIQRAEAAMEKIRSRIRQKMQSSSTSPFERDALAHTLKRLDERHRQLNMRKVEGFLHCEAAPEPIRK